MISPSNDREKYILEEFHNHNFLTDDLITFLKKKNIGDNISNEFTDRVYCQAKNRLIHHDMPIVMCDILGFSNKMEYINELDLYHDVICSMSKSSDKLDRFILEKELMYQDIIENKDEFKRLYPNNVTLGRLQFSDTLIIYPKILGSMLQLLSMYDEFKKIYEYLIISGILIATQDFYCNMIKDGHLIRGGISYGKILIQENPPTYIGKTISEVHYIEECQDWSGILLSPEIIKKIKLFQEESFEFDKDVTHLYEKLVSKFKPSIKLNCKDNFKEYYENNNIDYYVLEWRDLIKLDKNLIKKKAKNKDGIIENSVKKKICNTFNFYDDYYQK